MMTFRLKEIVKILISLGFIVKKKKDYLNLTVPSWRPDILQPIDIVEEIARIKGYDQIKTQLPEKVREIPTLNKQQKLFHYFYNSDPLDHVFDLLHLHSFLERDLYN